MSGLAISTAHLEEAVAAARNAHLADAHASLNQFRDLWNTSRADLEKLSPMIAEAVQMAYDQAAAVISDPTRPPPQQSEYLPVLQNLLQAVQNANTVLGGGATR